MQLSVPLLASNAAQRSFVGHKCGSAFLCWPQTRLSISFLATNAAQCSLVGHKCGSVFPCWPQKTAHLRLSHTSTTAFPTSPRCPKECTTPTYHGYHRIIIPSSKSASLLQRAHHCYKERIIATKSASLLQRAHPLAHHTLL
eukprot:1161989-Pelagomonas_calceolata.AAC.6